MQSQKHCLSGPSCGMKDQAPTGFFVALFFQVFGAAQEQHHGAAANMPVQKCVSLCHFFLHLSLFFSLHQLKKCHSTDSSTTATSACGKSLACSCLLLEDTCGSSLVTKKLLLSLAHPNACWLLISMCRLLTCLLRLSQFLCIGFSQI